MNEKIALNVDIIRFKYPRIAERIEITWGSDICLEYIKNLIFETEKFDREGFPDDVMRALMYLYTNFPEKCDDPDDWRCK